LEGKRRVREVGGEILEMGAGSGRTPWYLGCYKILVVLDKYLKFFYPNSRLSFERRDNHEGYFRIPGLDDEFKNLTCSCT